MVNVTIIYSIHGFFDMTKIAAVTIPTYQTFGTVESEETGGN
jgi:hypothetical protein